MQQLNFQNQWEKIRKQGFQIGEGDSKQTVISLKDAQEGFSKLWEQTRAAIKEASEEKKDEPDIPRARAQNQNMDTEMTEAMQSSKMMIQGVIQAQTNRLESTMMTNQLGLKGKQVMTQKIGELQQKACGICELPGHRAYHCWFNAQLHEDCQRGGATAEYEVFRAVIAAERNAMNDHRKEQIRKEIAAKMIKAKIEAAAREAAQGFEQKN